MKLNITDKGPAGYRLPNNGVETSIGYPSTEGVLAFLFGLKCSKRTYKAEYEIHNPKPKQFDPRYILPRDCCLWNEGTQMGKMAVDDMVTFGKHLVEECKVPVISITIDLDKQGDARFIAQALFDDKIRAVVDGDCPVMCCIHAGKNSRATNARLLQQIIDEAVEFAQAYFDNKSHT